MFKSISKLTSVALICAFCLTGGYSAFASQKAAAHSASQAKVEASGVVLDSQGQPVVGASIIEKGTTNSAVTDFNGAFKFQVKAGATVEILCIGYKDHAVKAGTNLKIVLADDAEFLNEAVVVGFGTQKKANLTGAVASVDVEKNLTARSIADVSRGLQGTTPGLTIQIGSSDVGSEAKINIRGQVGSASGSATPLILLDNVEIPSIQMVNPDDVESVSVLKDAASASIYGAKAAFGVILITSKKGSNSEKITVSYSNNFSFQNISKDYSISRLSGLQYAYEDMKRTGGTSACSYFILTEEGYQAAKAWDAKYHDMDPYEPMVYGRDWYVNKSNKKIGLRTYNPYEYLVRKNAPSQTHNVSIAGKTGKTTFNASFGLLDQKGMLKTSNLDFYKRYNANVRLSTRITDWFNVRAGFMYSRSNKSWPYTTNSTSAGTWYYIYRWGPLFPYTRYDEYGNLLRNQANRQSVSNAGTIVNSYTSVNGGFTITPLKGWNIDLDYTFSSNNKTETRNGQRYYGANTWTSAVKYYDENGVNPTVNNEWNEFNGLGEQIPAYVHDVLYYTNQGGQPDFIYRSQTEKLQHSVVAKTTYDLKIAEKHDFNFMLGFQSVGITSDGHWGQATTLMDYNNPQFDLTTGVQTAGGSSSWSSTAGFFGRVNYAFAEKYLLEANLRYDGSSKFPTSLKWQWFPSFSAGWRVTEEPWMRWSKPVLSSMKLRASWGSIGDQSVSSDLYIPTMSRSQTTYLHGGVIDYAYSTPSAVASDISWQRIQTLDFGLDIMLFQQVGITFDWFQRDTKDMIVGIEGLSANFGTSAPKANYGDLRTKGWELSVDWGKVFNNGFSFHFKGGVADAVTKITKYGSATAVSGWYNGKTYGEIWGYRVDRLFQNEDFAHDASNNLILVKADDASNPENYKYQHYKFADGKDYALQGQLNSGKYIFMPGDVKFKDLDGDGIITPGTNSINDHGDREVIGNTTPRYEYNFRVDLGWKGFDFSMFWQGVGKRDLTPKGSISQIGFSAGGAMAESFSDFWYEEKDANGNVTASNYGAFYPRAFSGDGIFNMVANDRYLLNMAYLRLKNVTLGYTIPAKVTKKIAFQKIRVYCSLENYLTFDHLNGLPIDVEEIPGYNGAYTTDTINSSRVGNDSPSFKSASFGIQFTF